MNQPRVERWIVPNKNVIHEPKTWPPGRLIFYRSDRFFGIGLVVVNNGTQIAVVWDANCSAPFRTYNIEQLNSSVIFTDP